MITATKGTDEVIIQDGKISLPEAFNFLKDTFDSFTVPPQAGSPEFAFFNDILKPFGFEITQQTEEPEEIY